MDSVKRFLLLVILFFLILSPRPVHAEDTGFTTVRINAFGTAIIREGQKIGLDVSGIIHTIFNDKEDDIAVPDFEPGADFTKRINEQNTPQHLTDEGKIIPAEKDSITYKSLLGVILRTGADHADEVPPTECFISSGVEETSPVYKADSAFQEAEMLDAFWGLFPKEPNDSGALDFRLPDKPLTGMNPNEDCKKDIPGIELPPVSNSLTSLTQFGEGTLIQSFMNTTIIKEIITIIQNGIPQRRTDYEREQERNLAILTKKMKQEWHQMLCHIGLCTSRDTGEKTKGLAQTGGAANIFLTEQDQYEVEPYSVQEYDIAIAGIKQPKKFPQSYAVVNDYYTRLKQACCSSTPDTTNASYGDMQDKVVLDDAENEIRCKDVCQSPVAAACSTTELPDLSTPQSSCSLCNAGLPKTLTDIFNKAAETYQVPASLIYSLFVSEGSDKRWDWSEANIKAWSVCGGSVPQCDEFATDTGARGPFSFLSTPTGNNTYEWSPDYAESSKAVDPERNEFSPCNLIDSTFAIAAKLQHESGGATAGYTPPTCWGYTLHGPGVPGHLTIASSCRADQWTESRIATAVRQSTGYCTETAYEGPGGYSGAQSADNNHFKRAVDYYNSYSCQP